MTEMSAVNDVFDVQLAAATEEIATVRNSLEVANESSNSRLTEKDAQVKCLQDAVVAKNGAIERLKNQFHWASGEDKKQLANQGAEIGRMLDGIRDGGEINEAYRLKLEAKDAELNESQILYAAMVVRARELQERLSASSLEVEELERFKAAAVISNHHLITALQAAEGN